MKRLIIKGSIYFFLILIGLEVIIRVFHLTKDTPLRYVDDLGVEKWIPNQEGYSVTGNRRQNFSKFNINNSGFNSYREFQPTKIGTEIALVGDSFIEGFHQDFRESIGKKMENLLENVEVYEYGYAGYDFADQMHLINAYKSSFDLIDLVFIGLRFEDDLSRKEYQINQDRMKLQTPLYLKLKEIKLLVYAQNIGVLNSLKEVPQKFQKLIGSSKNRPIATKSNVSTLNSLYIKNFESLVAKYGYNKSKFVLLIDKTITPKIFIDYLEKNNYKYFDFSELLERSELPTTLIYDQHWNNHGRTLIANGLVEYYKTSILTLGNK